MNGEGDEREACIQELVSRMTFEEKIEQMSGDLNLYDIPLMLLRYNLRTFNAGANKRLGIPPLRFTDGPRGVALNHSTCFPVSMARGASWDIDLEERVASAMGVEARAQGANLLAAVCVNLLHHPAWGRAQETFGEDSHLSGSMGAAMVRGLQKHIMACVKHFACNSIEGSRFYVDVRLDERSLREVYLPHFKDCIEAGAASIMAAYNKVNGNYCSHNSHLLRDILKGEWAFEGFVISDFIYGTRDTVRAAKGGLDVEMPNARYFGRKLRKAVWKGKVEPSLLDEAVTRILREKARFDSRDGTAYGRDRVASSEHTELALEAARSSIVLLKNDNDALPLKLEGISRIAVVGVLADSANLGDYGSSRVRPPYAVTPLQGIMNRVGDSAEVTYSRGEDFNEASRAAREADAVIVIAGLTGRDEGEALPLSKTGGDRSSLNLPREQVELIEAVCQESERCIVVLEGGSAITMWEWRSKPAAILMAWYPGMEGGHAIADIIFGVQNPSAKLPITFPESSSQLPRFDSKARSVQYGYYHGYRLFDKTAAEPAFVFGFGLHYTRYSYSNLRLSSRQIAGDGRLDALVDIRNDGEMEGREVVQMYVGYPASRIERPVKELKGFSLVHLKPGESKSVAMDLGAEDLAYYDVDSRSWTIEETEYTVYVGSSSRREDLLSENFFITHTEA
ncbi:MAG: hypothetical protein A2W01_12350 [Candidatus Solincola sediminis]|uniref:Exo-alpha-(1->6)-L-arabinopyranosidase n=1 Tax=Candidatus Solincola sediminis TaxID=1797199 RepID=A0A1F2WRW7_9ACTN|nr:MAG: hypothetical protein A2Y75_01225 [Candidatus Solincola sediminis]OFW60982.1 MAG: hypothetical protein A2W01_12350 [Candidatus Solincola sediminis]